MIKYILTILFLTNLFLIANDESLKNHLSVPFNTNNFHSKINYETLQSYSQIINYDKKIFRGDSLIVDLTEYLNENSEIIDIMPQSIGKLKISEESEYGRAYISTNKKIFKYFLLKCYWLDTLLLQVNYKTNNSKKDSLLIYLNVGSIDFPDCIFDGNYICNSGFETTKFAYCLDIFEYFKSCVGEDIILQWQGSSSDIYSKSLFFVPKISQSDYLDLQINASFFRTVISNNKFQPYHYYSPQTWDDDDINNLQFGGLKLIYRNPNNNNANKNSLLGESFYQNLKFPLLINKEYVLEYYVFLNNIDNHRLVNADTNINFYSCSVLADYDPCVHYDSMLNDTKYFEQIDDKIIIDKTYLKKEKWIHTKSKVFKLNKPMTWFWLGWSINNYFGNDFINYPIYFDDVIIREAGVGISSLVNNHNPCLGDIIQYTFKVWKDDIEDKEDVEIHNLLPKELTYVSGSFNKDTDGILKRTIKADEFDSLGIYYLYANVLIPIDDNHKGKYLTNEIYIPKMPEQYRASVGKYKTSIIVSGNLVEIEHKINSNKCLKDTSEIIVTLTNTSSSSIDNLSIFLHKPENLDIIWKMVNTFDTTKNKWVDIFSPNLFFNDKPVINYGYEENQFVIGENNDIILHNQKILPNENLIIKYYAIISDSEKDLILKTSAYPKFQGCKNIKSDTISLNPNYFKKDIFPNDLISCYDLTLYSPYPEFQNKWSDGSTGASLLITESGKYSLEITDPNGCTIKDSIVANINKEFDLQIKKNTNIMYKGDTLFVYITLNNKNVLNNIKKISINFQIDTNNLVLLKGDYSISSTEEKDNKTIYNILTQRKLSNNPYEKFIIVELKFLIKKVDDAEAEVIINNVEVNECSYLNKRGEINVIIGNDDLIKIPDLMAIEDDLIYYPAPFDDLLTVNFKIKKYARVKIQLNDLLGRLVDEFTFDNLGKGTFEYKINTNNYASGFYNLCLIVDNDIKCIKSIKLGR